MLGKTLVANKKETNNMSRMKTIMQKNNIYALYNIPIVYYFGWSNIHITSYIFEEEE